MRPALRGTPHFDAVLALIAFAALLIDPLASHQVTSLTPLDGGLALVTAVPLVLRRRYPLGVLAAIVPLLLACLAVFHPDHAAAGIVMVVVFTVGLHGHRTRALAVGALMAPVVAAGVLITSRRLGGDSAAETVAYLALVLGALAAGDAVRGRQELVRVLAAEAERERAALAQHRFDEQRLRYAHELHDVVGHALVAINVRAAAAAHLARREQGASPVSALEEIASTSAEALGELRTALKGLRNDDVPLRPARGGLADLDDLIAGVKGAGLTVELDMAAGIAAVPAGDRPRRRPDRAGGPDQRAAPLDRQARPRPDRPGRGRPADRGPRPGAGPVNRCRHRWRGPRPAGHARAGRRARRQL